jgi:hypothetical protein
MRQKFTSPRKLFSTVDQGHTEGFDFPGRHLPGPEAPRLTEDKTYDGRNFYAGDFDPEWQYPDEENTFLGSYNGRMYHSIRGDISTDLADLGPDPTPMDPQTHATVSQDVYNYLSTSPFLIDVFAVYGLQGTADSRLRDMFPNAAALKSAIDKNPNIITEFFSQDANSVDQVMAALGVVLDNSATTSTSTSTTSTSVSGTV